MKRLTYFIAALLCASSMSAQTDNGLFNHMSVGVSAGLNGIGVDVAMPVTNFMNVRAGYNFMPTIKVKKDLDINMPNVANYQQYIDYVDIPKSIEVEGKSSLSTGKLLIDLYPIKNSSFFISAGAYFGSKEVVKVYNTEDGVFNPVNKWNDFANTAAGKALNANEIGAKLGDYLLKPDSKGNANATIEVASFRPYLGLGFGRTVPQKHRMAFSCELGCQFWGSPTVYCNDQKLEKDKVGDSSEGGIIKTISKVSVYPSLTFRLAGKIF